MKRSRRARDAIYRVTARLGGWPRRLAALTCLLLAGVAFLDARAPNRSQHPVSVVVAARDLAPGRVLLRADLRLMPWPADVVPPAALRSVSEAVGAVVAAAMGSGEPLTTARLQGRGLAAGLTTGQVAIAVDLADSGSARLIQAGDLVDLLVGSASDDLGGSRTPHLLAQALRVLAVLPDSSTSGETDNPSTRLVVAVDTSTALRIAGALNSPIVATLRPSA